MDHAPAVGLGHALEGGHLVARPRRAAEVELHDLALLGQLDLLDLVEGLDPALHLRRLGRVGGEALDEALLLGQHGLLARVGRLAVGLADLPLALVEVVVAGVGGDLAAVDLRDARHHAVHELAVVRRHEEGGGQRVEERLEPHDRLDVEVVGGLVHEQDVRPAEEDARHGHAHLPAAGEGAHVAVDALVVEAEAVQDLARLRLEGVAAHVLVGLLHLAEAGEDGVHLVRARGIAHRVLQRLELVVQVAEAAAARDGLVEHGAAGHLLDVLAEVADGELAGDRDLALVRRLLSDDQAEERGLARAVGTDEPDLLARVELEGRVDEKDLPAVLLAEMGERDHEPFKLPRPR